MILRDAHAGDIDALSRIAADVYARVFRPLLPDADFGAFDAGHFAQRFSTSLPRIRVAANDTLPCGVCMTTDSNLDILFVADTDRNAGVGAALLRDAEQRGARTLECFAVNAAARRFYERHDWRMVAAYARTFAGAERNFVRYALHRSV